MEDLEVARILGQIEGRLKGIDDNIGDIKEAQRCQSRDCENCRKEIDIQDRALETEINKRATIDEVVSVKKRLADVEKQHTQESAVAGYLGNMWVQFGVGVGTVGGIISLILLVKGWIPWP